MYGM